MSQIGEPGYSLAQNHYLLICVAHRDPLIGDEVRRALHIEGYETLKATAESDIDAAMSAVRIPDAAIVDQELLPAILAWRHRGVLPPIIALQPVPNLDRAIEAIQNGAVDVVAQPLNVERLLSGLRSNLAGAVEQVGDARRRSGFGSLTPREREVLSYLLRGHTNKQIAANLGISPKTVELHRARVMLKTRSTSVADLVRKALC